ncbi:hypothetical protein GCM10010844_43880 [Deinococcus radiotolerans]|uniref:Uncharacterized protein n=1 Tax=Deinococcus radiotolerans TaxID=1309407 RepID=A0ABQ2FRR4_9DEIO|nr:hypothetical protein GCM10010844_43880 [Deinococcus radiotolerans]
MELFECGGLAQDGPLPPHPLNVLALEIDQGPSRGVVGEHRHAACHRASDNFASLTNTPTGLPLQLKTD